MNKAFYIIGTDTGCGKTIVTGAMAAFLRGQGRDVGVMKPFESASDDSKFLKEMSGSHDPLSTINPYHFDEPLAPAVAAERAGVEISFDRVATIFQELKDRHEILLIEGAGGLLVPLMGAATHVELLQKLSAPVLLVARLGLGTLNHTLLTLNVLEQNRIACCGVILNEVTPRASVAPPAHAYGTSSASQPLAGNPASVAEETNPEILQRYYDVPLLGVFSHLQDVADPQALSGTLPVRVKQLF